MPTETLTKNERTVLRAEQLNEQADAVPLREAGARADLSVAQVQAASGCLRGWVAAAWAVVGADGVLRGAHVAEPVRVCAGRGWYVGDVVLLGCRHLADHPRDPCAPGVLWAAHRADRAVHSAARSRRVELDREVERLRLKDTRY